jgi:hypothetical protein
MFLRHRLTLPFTLPLVATTLFPAACFANPTQDAASPVVSAPAPEIFAPGEISGPANDGAPTFSPDGNTLFFTRTTAQWTVIVESHKVNGHWSRPVVAPFSGEWSDSSPAMSDAGHPSEEGVLKKIFISQVAFHRVEIMRTAYTRTM